MDILPDTHSPPLRMVNGSAAWTGTWGKLAGSSQMHRLVYISRSLIGSDRNELEAIVGISAARNAAVGITGTLWFDKINFAQALEGERSAIDKTMRRINADKRHADIEVICDREIRQPMFGQWSMALPHDVPRGFEATAFLIGFARSEPSAAARKLYDIAIGSDGVD